MGTQVGVKPRWLQRLAIWAGADNYSLREALTGKEFFLPVDRVYDLVRIEIGVAGIAQLSRYLVSFRSEKRECIVILDSLPEALRDRPVRVLNPVEAVRLYLALLLREPSAAFSLLFIFGPMVLGFIFFLLWNSFVVSNHELMAVISNQSCDATCVGRVLKIHSMVGVVFVVPLGMVFLPIALMIFKSPRYQIALNYRLAQSFCVASLIVGMFFLGHLAVVFPFKGYSRFLMSGLGPRAVLFLKERGLTKR